MNTTTSIHNEADPINPLDLNTTAAQLFTTKNTSFGVRFESAYGAIAFLFTGLAAMIFCTITGFMLVSDRFDDLTSPPAIIALLIVAALGLTEIATLLRFSDCLKSRLHPVAPAFALIQPHWPRFFRPLIAIWWLAHLALPITALSVLTLNHLENLHGTAYWLLTSLLSIAGFGFVYATNIYLVLAVAAITPNPQHIFAVWKRRWFIDLAITATAYAAHQLV